MVGNRKALLCISFQVAAAQMQSAISGGISWGMGEDAVQEDDDSDDEVNWKLHVVKNKITEKQQKLVDKIRYV